MFQERLGEIRERMSDAAIRSGREPGDVRLLAASKVVPVERVLDAISSGQSLFGENYIQEAMGKIDALGDLRKDTTWHLIGHLQRNKAKTALELFDCIETVESVKLLAAINKHAKERDIIFPLFIQVNLSKEPQKSGIFLDDLIPFLKEAMAYKNIKITGLMTLPPFSDEPEDSRPWFSKLREVRDRINETFYRDFVIKELSMGMSHDFEVAIEEGATIVRVGTALFGERKRKGDLNHV
jgi:pyridoxal phosphate enzyme (YggS family)